MAKRPNPADDRLLVRFFPFLQLKAAESEVEGRPIYREVDMIEIRAPGDHTTVFTARAAPLYTDRFPIEWEAYRRGREAPMEGTPLSEWPAMPRTLAATLAAGGIKTVEQLAGVLDTDLRVIGPQGRQWRDKALAFIDSAKGAAAIQEYASRNQKLEDEVTRLKRQIEEIAAKTEKGEPKQMRMTA
jgi:hypothetical protein